MSNEYKDWISEQTFETLAQDNLRVKQQLLQLKAENENLTQKLEKAKEMFLDIERTAPIACSEWFYSCGDRKTRCKYSRHCEAVCMAKQALKELGE